MSNSRSHSGISHYLRQLGRSSYETVKRKYNTNQLPLFNKTISWHLQITDLINNKIFSFLVLFRWRHIKCYSEIYTLEILTKTSIKSCLISDDISRIERTSYINYKILLHLTNPMLNRNLNIIYILLKFIHFLHSTFHLSYSLLQPIAVYFQIILYF